MKIYQLHEYGGEYEDYFDHVVGSFMRRERAEEVKNEMIIQRKKERLQSDKCNQCPIHNDSYPTIEDYIKVLRIYCDQAEIVENYFGVNCENYYCLWEETEFSIEEVEVEE